MMMRLSHVLLLRELYGTVTACTRACARTQAEHYFLSLSKHNVSLRLCHSVIDTATSAGELCSGSSNLSQHT
jgi:hypothetical protein